MIAEYSTPRELLKSRADSMSETEVLEVLEYIAIMESLRAETSEVDALDNALCKLLWEAAKDTSTPSLIIDRSGETECR